MSSDVPPVEPPRPTGLPSSTEAPAAPVPPVAPLPYAYPAAAPARARNGLLIGGVIAGVLVVVAALVAAVAIVVSTVGSHDENPYAGQTPSAAPTDAGSAGAPGALITGDPGSPLAASPLNCDGPCFDDDIIGSTIPKPTAFNGLDLPTNTDPWGKFAATTADDEFDYQSTTWTKVGGAPSSCFVTYPGSPIVGPLEVPQTAVDSIEFTGTHANADETSSLSQSTRLFADTESATAYLTELDTELAGCTHYSSGTRDTYWEADVTREPALTLPDSVAAVGWAEDSVFDTRYYAIDLQRGNLVVRSTLITDGTISEGEFRTFVQELALSLADL